MEYVLVCANVKQHLYASPAEHPLYTSRLNYEPQFFPCSSTCLEEAFLPLNIPRSLWSIFLFTFCNCIPDGSYLEQSILAISKVSLRLKFLCVGVVMDACATDLCFCQHMWRHALATERFFCSRQGFQRTKNDCPYGPPNGRLYSGISAGIFKNFD
eukprot:4394161-Pleurochrysis_carterae.AAC.2